jgi:hypothetical protein
MQPQPFTAEERDVLVQLIVELRREWRQEIEALRELRAEVDALHHDVQDFRASLRKQ